MTDRELEELAAKAAGYNIVEAESPDRLLLIGADNIGRRWNPLTDDGDALRLAVTLRLEVYIHETDTRAIDGNLIATVGESHGNDKFAATRRAITRAAAEIGRSQSSPAKGE